MSAEIIELDVISTIDLPTERILRKATDANLEMVIVIGIDADGVEYFSSSVSSGPDVLWALERAKINLLRIVDPED